MRVTNQGRSRESAFTIVEVLVAALVITMVFAGAMYFVVGSGKGQQRTLVRQRMAAAADDIGQRVRADKDWLKQVPACKTSTCDLSSRFPVAPPKSGDAKLTASVKVSPVDGRGDGVGAADADHIVPDFFRIQVTVSMAASEQAKWGHQSNFETVSTVDATALGRAVGSLVVQTCEVTNQVDERMSFAGCEGGGGSRRAMEKQPAPCSSLPPLTWAEWLNKRPVLPHGCNAAFDAADAKSHDLTSMHVASTGSVGFTLTRDGSDGGGSVARTSGDADSGSGSGTYVFSGLPAGSYKLTVSPGAGRELWKSHTIPSAGVASVQANQEARAMIVVRPKQGVGEYRARFSRDVYLFSMGTETGSDTYTESDGVTTVQTVTTYLYLVAKGPVKETWAGPAWSGLLGMEAKPFDRYRDATNSVSQPLTMVAWAPRKAADNGWVTLGPLPSGLHSLPAQQPAPVPPPDDTWGSFGGRSQQCLGGTPGGSCGAFAWIARNGDADSTVSFHSTDGECYVESDVALFSFPRKLANGGGHADRCSRDLLYVNPQSGKRTLLKGFLPDRNGNGGGRMVISMQQTTSCVSGCGAVPPPPATGSVGYIEPTTSGPGQSVAPASAKPRTPPAAPPKLVITPDPPTSTSTGGGAGSPFGGSSSGGSKSMPSVATAVPMANG